MNDSQPTYTSEARRRDLELVSTVAASIYAASEYGLSRSIDVALQLIAEVSARLPKDSP